MNPKAMNLAVTPLRKTVSNCSVKSNYDCPARRYAEQVLEDRIPAGRWVKFACGRHIDDLSTGGKRGLWFDYKRASHFYSFCSHLRHSKGRWGRQPFKLEPWQHFIGGSLFGWKRRGGCRRFKIGFVEVPRKNGKTTFAAAIGNYILTCDGEAGAEIYSAATKRDQAKLVFADAKAFISGNQDLAERVQIYKHSLQIPSTRSKFEPLAAEAHSLDGLNPHLVIADEIHAWKDRSVWDVLLTGMGAREQPLALAITTAGDFSDSIYNELHNDAEQILEGVVEDDDFFAYVATIDPGDDWLDERAWAKANPNLGVSLRVEELRSELHRAKRLPASQNKQKRLRLGIRTSDLSAWLPMDCWELGGERFDEAELLGKSCGGGLDLANTQDLAAWAMVFPWGMDRGKPVFRHKIRYWCPEDARDNAAETLRRKLYPWAQAGYVEFTPGSAIDLERITQVILEDVECYKIEAVCYDPWNAEAVAQKLVAGGLNVQKFVQSAATYNAPAQVLESAILEGRFRHNGNPVFRWNASNCVARRNGNGYLMPDRKRSRDKIDGIPATLEALAAIGAAPESSVYETRGVDE